MEVPPEKRSELERAVLELVREVIPDLSYETLEAVRNHNAVFCSRSGRG